MSYYKLLLLSQAYTEGTKKKQKEKEVEEKEKENLRTMSTEAERKIKGKKMHLFICQNILKVSAPCRILML